MRIRRYTIRSSHRQGVNTTLKKEKDQRTNPILINDKSCWQEKIRVSNFTRSLVQMISADDGQRETWLCSENMDRPCTFCILFRTWKGHQVIRKEGRYNVGLGTIKKMLSNKETYTVQKPTRQNFPKSRAIVSGLNAQWDGDLCSMQNVARVNDDLNVLLVLIDIFSRFLMLNL